MTPLKALVWDVDGTLAETERDGHLVAFNLAFEAFGLPWRWDDAHYADLLRISGGRERMQYDMTTRPDAPALAGEREALVKALHIRKNTIYAELMQAGQIPLREGVAALIDQCHSRGVLLAIATTTSRSNLDALMRVHFGQGWIGWFAATVCGEDVQSKKPDPEVYVRALKGLGIGPLGAVAIEDSPGGVAAARAADIPVVVTRSAYFETAAIEGAIAIGPGLHSRRGWRPALSIASDAPGPVGLEDIQAWRAQMDTVSDHP